MGAVGVRTAPAIRHGAFRHGTFPDGRRGAPNARILRSRLSYEQVRQVLVAELCGPRVSGAMGAAQLTAVLAFAADVGQSPGRVFEVPDRVCAYWVLRMLASPRTTRLGWPDDGSDRAWVKIDEPTRLLARFGYRGAQIWDLSVNGSDAAIGTIRGAIAAAGTIDGQGLQIRCPAKRIAASLRSACASVGITIGDDERSNTDILVPSAHVSSTLAALGVSGVVSVIERVQRAEVAEAQRLAKARAAANYSGALAATNAERARAAAAADCGRIAALGDLSDYGLAAPLVQAAQVRRDHPDLTFSQAAALLGISKDAFAGRLRRFWKAIDATPTGERSQS